MELSYRRSMEQFDWIAKSIIGMLGTATSVILNDVSTFLSALAALATTVYMVKQYMNATRKDKRAQEIHEKKIDD